MYNSKRVNSAQSLGSQETFNELKIPLNYDQWFVYSYTIILIMWMCVTCIFVVYTHFITFNINFKIPLNYDKWFIYSYNIIAMF